MDTYTNTLILCKIHQERRISKHKKRVSLITWRTERPCRRVWGGIAGKQNCLCTHHACIKYKNSSTPI